MLSLPTSDLELDSWMFVLIIYLWGKRYGIIIKLTKTVFIMEPNSTDQQ